MKFNRDRGDISEVKHVLGELLSFYLNTQNRRKKKLKKEKMEFWGIFRFHLFGRKKMNNFEKNGLVYGYGKLRPHHGLKTPVLSQLSL
jgi:hypothetical protein